MLWNSNPARRYLVGAERTANPTPAAAFLLGKRLGRARKAARGIPAFRLRRRRTTSNPLPAVAAVLASKLGGLGGRFRAPSEKRAAGAATQLVAAAVAGNLTAAKTIAERVQIGIAKERAVWRRALAQVPARILQLVQRYAAEIPGADQSSPEAAAESAIARAVDASALEAQSAAARGAISSAAARRAAQAEAKQARREELLAGVGGQIGSALLGRGRSLRRRPRRRTRALRF